MVVTSLPAKDPKERSLGSRIQQHLPTVGPAALLTSLPSIQNKMGTFQLVPYVRSIMPDLIAGHRPDVR
jgi:hypothetical protein